jgi:hypothetical protein
MQKDLSLTGKYIQFALGIAFTLILSGCSDVQKHEKPENLIPKDKMVEVYTDMIILDALDRTSPRTLKSFEVEISDHILKKFNLDSTTLAQNIAYYNLEFETNAEIYDKVTKNISEKKDEIDSIVNLRDSLKREERKLKNKIKNDSIIPQNKKSLQKIKQP